MFWGVAWRWAIRRHSDAIILTLVLALLDQDMVAGMRLFVPAGAVLPLAPSFSVMAGVLDWSSSAPYLKWGLPILGVLFGLYLFQLDKTPGRMHEVFLGRPVLVLGAAFTAMSVNTLITFWQIGYIVLGIGSFAVPFTLPLLSGLYAIAALAGNRLYWRGTPAESLVPLTRPRALRMDFRSLRKGIDNVRADVFLPPAFLESARTLIQDLTEQCILRLGAGTDAAQPLLADYECFKGEYARLMENALHRAKQGNDIAIAQLAHVAALDYVLNTATAEYERVLHTLRSDTKSSYDPYGKDGAGNLAMYDYVRATRANKDLIVSMVAQGALSAMQKVDELNLSSLSLALFGTESALPFRQIYNPLLTAGDQVDEQILLRYYLLFGHRETDMHSYAAFRRLIDGIVCRDVCHFCAVDGAGSCHTGRVGGGGSWSDEATNISVLFVPEDIEAYAPPDWSKDDPRRHAHRKLQRRLWRKLRRRIVTAGLERTVVAAYHVPSFYFEQARAVNPHILHQYLAGRLSFRVLRTHLRASLGKRANDEFLRKVRALRWTVSRETRRGSGPYVLRLLHDVARYRRDQYYCRRIAELRGQVHLLTEPDDVRLSRINRVLFDFSTPPGDNADGAEQDGHVIIKADIRGSTSLTAAMMEQGLNPATHFSEYFFDPINQLLKQFGAEKVFVEGDAIILSFPAQRGSTGFAVARACGLARSIIAAVKLLNQGCSKHNLPCIEAGIGITYDAQPAAYLLDGDKPIMISSAIGRADRLSSCSADLRRRLKNAGKSLYRVAVYRAPACGSIQNEKGEATIRYNVDGIELEEEAFLQLQKEVELLPVSVTSADGMKVHQFYAGRYPDMSGVYRWLILRRGRIGIFGSAEAESAPVGYYYEVISHPALIEQVLAVVAPEGVRQHAQATAPLPS